MCLKNVGRDVRAWADTGSPSIEGSVDCVVRGLDRFSDRVRADGADWTVEDIDSFLAKHFKTSDNKPTIAMALRVKQAWLGGEADRLTRAELARLRAMLVRVKPELGGLSQRLNLAILRAESGRRVDADIVAETISHLAAVFADEISHSKSERPPMSFTDFAAGLEQIGLGGEGVNAWVPLAKSVKGVLAGGDSERVEGREWPQLFRAVGRAWGLTVRLRYTLKDSPDLFGQDLSVFEAAVHDSMDLAATAIQSQHSDSGITQARLKELIIRLGERDLLPKAVSVKTINDLWPAILGKLLYGVSRDGWSEKAQGFSSAQLAILRSAFDDWAQGQRSLLQALRQAVHANDTAPAFSKAFAALIGTPRFDTRGFTDELPDLLNRGRMLVRDTEGRLLIERPQQIPQPRRGDLDMMNLVRAVVARLISGYAHDGKEGLSAPEIQEIYLDARQLGRELGFIDVRNTTAGTRTFMEASLFTTVAQGAERANLHQLVEWFMMAYGGIRSAGNLHLSLLDRCGLSQVDADGIRALDITCFRQHVLSHIHDIVPNLPGLLTWLDADATRLPQLLEALENAGRAAGMTNMPMDYSDTKSLLPILYYTENLFVTHDRNGNDRLDNDEIRAFYPIIRPFIADLIRGKVELSEFWLQAVFTWMIRYGEPPGEGKVAGAKLWLWGKSQDRFDLHATRLDVLKVMGSFAAFNRQGRLVRIQNFLNTHGLDLRSLVMQRDTKAIADLVEGFQCQKDLASGDFIDLLREHLDELAPSGVWIASPAFITRVKTYLRQDPRFIADCMPF